MIRTVEEARNFRKKVENAASFLEDKAASLVVEISKGMRYDNSLISAGSRINWKGTLKRATVDIWDVADNNPDNAPTLWEDILYRLGYRIIPETITTGTAFSSGECGWWGDVLYKSLIDNNVWTPDAYPSGWELAE